MSLKRWLAALFTVAALFVQTCIMLRYYVTVGPASGGVPPSPLDFVCSLNKIQCPSKTEHCIHILELCNGIIDCPDGSDENATLCKAYDCSAKDPPTLLRYPYPNGDHERDFTSKKCPSGNMCTMASVSHKIHGSTWSTPWLCDGVKHCADGSDEDLSYCEKLHRDMAADSCTYDTPGVADVFFNTRDTFSHIVGVCPSRTHCVLEAKLCDGRKDCPDGSDEWPSFCCTIECFRGRNQFEGTTSFRCKDWGCLKGEDQVCDGIKDCGDGSDEDREFCAAYECPMSNGKKCPDNLTCLKQSQICDGSRTCPDGSDENALLCRDHRCSEGRYKCKDGMQCSGVSERADEYSSHVKCESPVGDASTCKDKSDAFNGLCRFPSLGPSGVDCGSRGLDKCPSGDGCLAWEHLCDGKKDCRDGSDEGEFCKTYDYRNTINSCFMSGITGERSPIMCMKNLTCICGGLCNGWIDCEDKSDEDPTFCRTYKCPFGFQKCPNYPYQCVPETSLCDGFKDCVNGGDEDSSLCKSIKCRAGYTRVVCANDTEECLPDDIICNGVRDCENGGDEAPDFCKTFKCPPWTTKLPCGTNSYQCIYDSWLCDGISQGINGCDESPALCKNHKCSEYLTKCPNSTNECVLEGALCDGVKQCTNGGDEDPSLCKNFKCQNGFAIFECAKNAYQCLPQYQLCNGHQDCVSGGGDEDPEFCKTFTCASDTTKVPCGTNSYQCIYSKWVCDAIPQYNDGCDEDPAFCKNHKCGESMTKCPKSATYQCVAKAALCDGIEDCREDGADEDPTFCALYRPNRKPEPLTANANFIQRPLQTILLNDQVLGVRSGSLFVSSCDDLRK